MDADALVKSLISRIGEKIAALGNGSVADVLENDPLVTQTVRSLVHLSQYKAPITTECLLSLLEGTITGPSDDLSNPHTLSLQAFILKMLDSCLSRHWAFCVDPNILPASSRGSIIVDEAASEINHREDDTLSVKSSKVAAEGGLLYQESPATLLVKVLPLF
ncbi:hypothetical protein DSO57_1023770 [Entomophthora muscae]|uniref:Uncharacterized protein n=1 Tax=Entomophthora muscae TaxID=34485 RepID=A0ACC2SG51_9FUNG|nr:hypothetical protein DSO57_1023770 [Entomophthora muscae]